MGKGETTTSKREPEYPTSPTLIGQKKSRLRREEQTWERKEIEELEQNTKCAEGPKKQIILWSLPQKKPGITQAKGGGKKGPKVANL